jgi:hypothetical protein
VLTKESEYQEKPERPKKLGCGLGGLGRLVEWPPPRGCSRFQYWVLVEGFPQWVPVEEQLSGEEIECLQRAGWLGWP